MFWNHLSKEDGETYNNLLKKSRPWIAWANLKEKDRELVPEPPRPSDEEWILMDQFAKVAWEAAAKERLQK